MNNKLAKIKFNKSTILLAIFLTAMVLRIGLNVARQELFFRKPFITSVYRVDERTSCDAAWYIYAAKAFLNGKGIMSRDVRFTDSKPETSFATYSKWKKIDEHYFAHKLIPPLYSLFLSFCFFVGGFNTLAYFIPQIILSSLTCLFVYFIAEEIFNKMTALFASCIVVFNLELIFWAGFARTETLFIFLLGLGFWLLLKGNSRRNLLLIYVSAVIFGLACLTRVTFLPFLPILFIWQVFSFSKNRKEGFKTASVMALIIFAVLLPWGIRNYIVFNEFTFFSEETGILIGSIENGEQYGGIDINRGYESHSVLIFKILVFIKDNFREYLASCWYRFMIFWSPFTNVMHSWAKVYKGLLWLVIFPASFVGMIISRKKWKSGVRLIVIFIFYYALLHSASFMDLGLIYRYPILPFLCIFAGYSYSMIYRKIKHSIKKKEHVLV